MRLFTESSTVRRIPVRIPVSRHFTLHFLSMHSSIGRNLCLFSSVQRFFTDMSMPGSVEGRVPCAFRVSQFLRAWPTKATLTSSPSCSPPCDGGTCKGCLLDHSFSISKPSGALLFSDLPTLKKVILTFVAGRK